MNEKKWERIEKILDQLIEVPKNDRKRKLKELVQDSPSLYDEILPMLDHLDPTSQIFQKNAAKYFKTLADNFLEEADREDAGAFVSREIGPYRTTKQIGFGGMGSVFLAERSDGAFERKVALKFIRTEYSQEEVKTRFKQEQKIQARLNHPGVARLFDTGFDENGTPYIVMEYVEGKHLTDYLEKNSLSLNEKLELFLKISDAVAYAHQNFVVHRDLKPSNILVQDDGTPKLVDFGIAKLLDSDEEDPFITSAGFSFVSYSYAAPEQLRKGPITAATDVYSLGVILHEMLTGLLPYDISEPTRPKLEEAICELPVPKPSTRLMKTGAGEKRNFNLPEPGQMKGDLDNILLKTLEKDPERRYKTVDALIDDIHNFLENKPVTARAPGVVYKTQKFIKRNAAVVAVAAAVLLLAAAGLIYHLNQVQSERNIALIEAEKANRAADFMVQIFRNADPEQALGEDLPVGAVLEQGVEDIGALDDQPEVQAYLYRNIGDIYASIGLDSKATDLLRRAVEISAVEPGEKSIEYLNALTSHAFAEIRMGSFDQAIANMERVFELHESVPGVSHSDLGRFYRAKALAYRYAGKNQEALEPARRSLEIREEYEPNTRNHAVSLSSYSDVLYELSRFEEAIEYTLKALEINRELYGDFHPSISGQYGNLGFMYGQMGDLEQAVEYLTQALEIDYEIHNPPHRSMATKHYNIGYAYLLMDNFDPAEEHITTSYQMYIDLYGEGHPEALEIRMGFVMLEMAQENYQTALDITMEILEAKADYFGPDHPYVAADHRMAAHINRDMNRHEASEHHAREALRIYDENDISVHLDRAEALEYLAFAHFNQERFERAIVRLEEAKSILEQIFPDGNYRIDDIEQKLEEFSEHS